MKRIILLVLVLFCLWSPAAAEAKFSAKVERYRPVIVKQAKALHMDMPVYKQNRILNCIAHESGGNPHSTSTFHKGILQYTSKWAAPTKIRNKYCKNFCGHGKSNWRFCPHANIYRFLGFAKHYKWNKIEMKRSWTTYKV